MTGFVRAEPSRLLDRLIDATRALNETLDRIEADRIAAQNERIYLAHITTWLSRTEPPR